MNPAVVMQTRVGNGRYLSKIAAMGVWGETAVMNPAVMVQTRVGNGRCLFEGVGMRGMGGNGRYGASDWR